MAAYFIDLDGTFFLYGSMDPAPGAEDSVKRLIEQGNQVIFVTARKEENNDPAVSLGNTLQFLRDRGIAYTGIIGGVESPRILINDDGAEAVNHHRNTALTIRSQKDKIKSAHDSLCTLRYICGDVLDADEYVQTLLLAYSLRDAGRFDYRMIVEYYRKCPIKTVDGTTIYNCGNTKDYPGQISKLAKSDDPLYRATDGITSGAGMKVSPMAMFYKKKEEMILNTILYTQITHNTPDAILCGILVALRFYQVIQLGENNKNWLVSEIDSVPWLYGIKDSDFFLSVVHKAADIVEKTSDDRLLNELHENVGLGNLCWCCPVSAVFWSYRLKSVEQWIDIEVHNGPREINSNGIYIPRDSIRPDVKESYLKRAAIFGQTDLYYWADSVDRDTFFSIALGIVAAKHGISDKIYSGPSMFRDDLMEIASKLISA